MSEQYTQDFRFPSFPRRRESSVVREPGEEKFIFAWVPHHDWRPVNSRCAFLK